jgi:hypothetical protein
MPDLRVLTGGGLGQAIKSHIRMAADGNRIIVNGARKETNEHISRCALAPPPGVGSFAGMSREPEGSRVLKAGYQGAGRSQ